MQQYIKSGFHSITKAAIFFDSVVLYKYFKVQQVIEQSFDKTRNLWAQKLFLQGYKASLNCQVFCDLSSYATNAMFCNYSKVKLCCPKFAVI